MTPKQQIIEIKKEVEKLYEDYTSKKILLAREEIEDLILDYRMALNIILELLDAVILNKK